MAKISNYVGYGLHADRPSAGAAGAVYFESDTGGGFRDNGASWDQISTNISGTLGLPARTVTHTNVNLTMTAANALVITGAHPVTVQLPHAAGLTGQSITVMTTDSVGPLVQAYSGEGIEYNTGSGPSLPMTVMSDGTKWYDIDF